MVMDKIINILLLKKYLSNNFGCVKAYCESNIIIKVKIYKTIIYF